MYPPPTSSKILQAEAEGFVDLLPVSATSLPTEDPLLANLALQEVWEHLTETIKEPLPLHAISTSTLPRFDPTQLVVQFFITHMNGTIARGTALINTGASSSFVNEYFIHQHQLLKQTHPSPVKIQAFDGTSGQPVTNLWVGNFTLRSDNGTFATSAVQANITRLTKADLILGMLGLVDGMQQCNSKDYCFQVLKWCQQDLLVALKIDDIPCFLHKFRSVFSSFSQSFLPPLQTCFDCTIKLKPNCIPPFGGLYQLSNEEKIQLKAYINDLLKKGFIQVDASRTAMAAILSQPNENNHLRLTRWASLLSDFHFIIAHTTGHLNPADPPSRRPDYSHQKSESTPPQPLLMYQNSYNPLALSPICLAPITEVSKKIISS
ncbi:hypothetical protein O181_026618 [Austropuccinia psidii MF-1]|uniref:Reverse transcriptase/retrotransposon-derived protein RNase H-like domain-containing protein n=1 Tax=Austropuccinia psidii MF-1 TaxID=1389203 RepID=A0A9Q3CMX4_9BASI|nr:hypothetical protein [Austropuccinia psidii MF-1]